MVGLQEDCVVCLNESHVGFGFSAEGLCMQLGCFWLFLCRSDELRALFERFGEVRDVYLPRDYYTE